MLLAIYLLTIVISVALLCADFKLADLDVCIGDLMFFTFISLIPVANLIVAMLTLVIGYTERTKFFTRKVF